MLGVSHLAVDAAYLRVALDHQAVLVSLELDQFRQMMNTCTQVGLDENVTSLKVLSHHLECLRNLLTNALHIL